MFIIFGVYSEQMCKEKKPPNNNNKKCTNKTPKNKKNK